MIDYLIIDTGTIQPAVVSIKEFYPTTEAFLAHCAKPHDEVYQVRSFCLDDFVDNTIPEQAMYIDEAADDLRWTTNIESLTFDEMMIRCHHFDALWKIATPIERVQDGDCWCSLFVAWAYEHYGNDFK